jgi:hypothetical protein
VKHWFQSLLFQIQLVPLFNLYRYAEDVVWEDLGASGGAWAGREAVFAALSRREQRDAAAGATLVVERRAPGRTAAVGLYKFNPVVDP